jgi:hypothetical protein
MPLSLSNFQLYLKLKIIKSLVVCSPAASNTKLHCNNASAYPSALFLFFALLLVTHTTPEQNTCAVPKNYFVYFLKQAPSTIITSTAMQKHAPKLYIAKQLVCHIFLPIPTLS